MGESMPYNTTSPTTGPTSPTPSQGSPVPPHIQILEQEVLALSLPQPSRPLTPVVHQSPLPSSNNVTPPVPEDEDDMPLGEGWFCSQPGIHTTCLTVPPYHGAPEDELIDAKYLRFTINYNGEPTIEATMGRGEPHYALPIMASPVEGRCTPPANDKEDLAFLAETHMMNSALNWALEGLGDYGVYTDVIRLRNSRRRANELDHQNSHIKALEVFARQQRLCYKHQRWEHAECQKEVRTRLIRANASGCLWALIREDPELGKQKRKLDQVKPYHLRGGVPSPTGTESAGLAGHRCCHTCHYCQVPGHFDKDCETPHYLCTMERKGRCVMGLTHKHHAHDLPRTCPYGGCTVKKSKYYLGLEEEQAVMDYVPVDGENADD
jgi:hypothetical protein